MSGPLDQAGDSVLPISEVIALFDDPVALFDPEDRLILANAGFRTLFSSIGQFIRPGTPWSIFLAEAERKDALTDKTCMGLQKVGELLLLTPSDVPPVAAEFADGMQAEILMTALSDGALRCALRAQHPVSRKSVKSTK